YLEFLTQSLMPSFVSAWPKVTPERREAFLHIVGVTALPAAAPDFLAAVPADKLRALPPRWEALRPRAVEEPVQLAVDTVLEALWKKLGNEPERSRVETRLQANPARTRYLPSGVEHTVFEIRLGKLQALAFMELFGY
ncbi:MAG TPA: hypothetical protein VKD71_14505, partial [Gemmataceae bacterium]|nr:hypothetical protein [Gemmataceae bacterium]